MIVGQMHDDKLREFFALALLARLHEILEFAEEFVGAELVGIVDVEGGKAQIGVIAQFGHGWDACA